MKKIGDGGTTFVRRAISSKALIALLDDPKIIGAVTTPREIPRPVGVG